MKDKYVWVVPPALISPCTHRRHRPTGRAAVTPVDTAYRTPKARFPLSHEGALRRRSEVTQVEAWERWVLRRVGVEPVRKRPQPHTVLTRKPLVSP